MKLTSSCSKRLPVMGMGASGSLLDKSERIVVASVYEEREGEIQLGSGETMGWKGVWEKFEGVCLQFRNSSGVSASELCDIRPEWKKCNLFRFRIFSSEPSELVILKD